jgi:hypothetical protein
LRRRLKFRIFDAPPRKNKGRRQIFGGCGKTNLEGGGAQILSFF